MIFFLYLCVEIFFLSYWKDFLVFLWAPKFPLQWKQGSEWAYWSSTNCWGAASWGCHSSPHAGSQVFFSQGTRSQLHKAGMIPKLIHCQRQEQCSPTADKNPISAVCKAYIFTEGNSAQGYKWLLQTLSINKKIKETLHEHDSYKLIRQTWIQLPEIYYGTWNDSSPHISGDSLGHWMLVWTWKSWHNASEKTFCKVGMCYIRRN